MDCVKALNIVKAVRDILDEISEDIATEAFDHLINGACNQLDEAMIEMKEYMENYCEK